MRGKNWVASVVVAGALLAVPAGMIAQTGGNQGPAPSVTSENSSDAGRVSRELLTSTVHEAWLASGRNEDKFFDMVKQMAELSAHKRGVNLPDTEEAGRQMGNLIKENARRDPDQLLYAVVDTAVKQTAGPAAAARR